MTPHNDAPLADAPLADAPLADAPLADAPLAGAHAEPVAAPGTLVGALRSVDLRVPDLDAAERFYTAVWGLEVAARAPGRLWLRATGRDHHVLALEAGGPSIRSITFRAASRAALDAIARRAVAAGGTLLPSVDDPAGGAALCVRDPQGRTLRIVHGDARRAADPVAPDRPTRLSHVNVNSRDNEACRAFLEAAFGMRLSDRSRPMSFVRCNGDHHVVVIADAPVDTLNHVAFLMPDLEGVMLGSGRLVDHGFPIAWGVGRHGPGNNVFAYFVDPFGIVVEYTAEMQQVGDDHRVRGPAEWAWPPGRTDRWGIAPPKGARLIHAQLAIPFA